MNRKLTAAVAAALLVVGGAYYLWAQIGGMNGPRQGQRQMGGMQRPMGQMNRGMMPGGMGGCAMVQHGGFIYALSGGTLFKVNPDTMAVMKELSLRPKAPAAGAPAGGMPEGGQEEGFGDEE
ncbi:MAG: hypothetical protein M0011_11695 [Elusimicrobia bacterium]|nr:hypothetical protein [Elusimicrobiota bacterium]